MIIFLIIATLMLVQFLEQNQVAGKQCPSSDSPVHASCVVTITFGNSCDAVRNEIKARVDGQSTGAWIDPHNNGTYAIENQSLWNRLDISRMSGAAAPGSYTDRIAFTFAEEGAVAVSDPSTPATPACWFSGCSDSQAHRFIQSTQTLALPHNPRSNSPNSKPKPNPDPQP